jgi:hypothetical protein
LPCPDRPGTAGLFVIKALAVNFDFKWEPPFFKKILSINRYFSVGKGTDFNEQK